jgi:hypothetical protein
MDMPALEELEHRVARLETLFEDVLKERINLIATRLDQIYEKTERDKTEILAKTERDKKELVKNLAAETAGRLKLNICFQCHSRLSGILPTVRDRKKDSGLSASGGQARMTEIRNCVQTDPATGAKRSVTVLTNSGWVQ